MARYLIPHFGMAERCEYDFSDQDLTHLRRYLESVSAVEQTDYVKSELFDIPWAVTGTQEQSIAIDAWASLLTHLRPLFMENEPYNFARTLEIAARRPVAGTEPFVGDMVHLLSEFATVVADQFENPGEMPLCVGKQTYTRWQQLKIWGYAYLWHRAPNRIRTAERLGILRDDPAFRASCSSAIMSKLNAIEALADLAKDILFWTMYPESDLTTYAPRAAPRSREPRLEERHFTRRFATFKRAGLMVSGNQHGVSLGMVTGHLSVEYVERIDRVYVRGLHYRTGSSFEAKRGILSLSLLNPLWTKNEPVWGGVRRMSLHCGQGNLLKADVTSVKAAYDFEGPSQLTFDLISTGWQIIRDRGPVDEALFDIR